jgi:hypothetical protein
MKIDEFTERQIKDAADIVDVVSDYVALSRSGAEYTGLCPFHDDRHKGSFMVSQKKQIAHCFPCGKTWDAVQFVMDMEGLDYPDALRWLAQKYGIFVDDAKTFEHVRRAHPRPPRAPEPPKQKRTWPTEWVERYMADKSDNLVNWLYSLPWDGAQRARLPNVLKAYGVGHSHIEDTNRDGSVTKHDFTIFWQMDELGRLHNGHLLKYGTNGHRLKDKTDYPMTWIHARMKRAKVNPFDEDTQEASYCLFGQHLLKACPAATVNIVESEKTAVIMAIAYGGAMKDLWMACFGIGNLTNSNRLLKPLIDQGRRIVLYPDRDGIERWKKAASEIDYPRLTVNTDPVTKWWKPRDGDKADIADIILRYMAEKPSTPEARANNMLLRYQPIRTLSAQLNLHAI